jgi:hypothetical protein
MLAASGFVFTPNDSFEVTNLGFQNKSDQDIS